MLEVLHVTQQRWEEDQVRIAQTQGGVQLRGANVVPIGTGGTTRPLTSTGTLMGWVVRETAGAIATINLRDGDNPASGLILPIGLAAAGFSHEWFGPGGLSIQEGVFVETVAGAFVGSLFFRGSE